MVTPAYVAKKVNDRYELVRQDDEAKAERLPWAVGGSALMLYAVARRGMLGLVALVAGADMLNYGFTGSCFMGRLVGSLMQQEPAGNSALAPSYQHDATQKSPQMPADEVEEASMESFPASDSPAYIQTSLPTREPTPGDLG